MEGEGGRNVEEKRQQLPTATRPPRSWNRKIRIWNAWMKLAPCIQRCLVCIIHMCIYKTSETCFPPMKKSSYKSVADLFENLWCETRESTCFFFFFWIRTNLRDNKNLYNIYISILMHEINCYRYMMIWNSFLNFLFVFELFF